MFVSLHSKPKEMKRKLLFLLSWLAFLPLTAFSQASDPKVNALAYYSDNDGKAQESNSIKDGQAPLAVTFKANPSDMGDWTPSFEWHFSRTSGGEQTGELFVRYDEETSYTFTESGTYSVTLKTYLRDGDFTADLPDQTISIVIAASKLEFPNAFSPNGDGINDKYQAKKDYKSIVSFRAIILNRWGQKLYEWDDPAGGWDGKYNGHDVAQGVYFVLVKAKGADGVEYNFKKDVNLLRGYTDTKNNTTGQ